MMMHAQTGVDKGVESSTGNPIEVMGFLVGRLDVDEPNSLIIQDAIPIAADGFETRYVMFNFKNKWMLCYRYLHFI
jgi:hypothetical protein